MKHKLKCLKNSFLESDIFGHPIRLLYKGNYTKKTLPGAIISVLFYLALIAYLSMSIIEIADKKFTLNYLSNPHDFTNDISTITRDKFDFAINILSPIFHGIDEFQGYVDE